MRTNFYNIQRQQGAVLLMSLVLLIVLTLLGISALDSTKLETKMAANVQENHTAFQAANAGLDQAYHHYVFQGKTNEYKDLSDFPDNEWNDKGVVITKTGGTTGLNFANYATSSLRLKKVIEDSGTSSKSSPSFYIIESKGMTGCVGGECNGHEVTLVEGWSFEGAKSEDPFFNAKKECLANSTDACRQIFANLATCSDVCPTDPTNVLCSDLSCPNVNDALATCSTNAEGKLLSPECPRIFLNSLVPPPI